MFDDPWCGSMMPEIAGFGPYTDNIPLISQVLHWFDDNSTAYP